MSSIEDSMSSGSRMRQFGLYRTIDARTEEFLRLSRKRQIRQGCACAAASTAITVTVVIMVFFVYEFSLNSGTQLEKSLKYNWLSLINDTEDGTSFDPKLTKASIDRTTLKLLPLLLKAMKKNAALEKLFDDQSSSISPNDENDNNDDLEQKTNQNTHTNKWLKMPTTSLFAVDHKTLPIIFYRDPTKNIELYTKIRKIRDYQRVFKYVDKMINEKVYIRSTKPMQPETSYNTITTSKPVSKKKTTKHMQYRTIVDNKNNSKEEKCKCANHLRELLNKILIGIETILPEIKRNEKNGQSDCVKHKPTSTKAGSNFLDVLTNLTTSLTNYSSEKTIPPFPRQLKKAGTFAFGTDILTETYELESNKTYHSSELNKLPSLSKNDLKYVEKMIDSHPIKPKSGNKFHNVVDRKHVLKRQELKSSTKSEPSYDVTEYDESYGYYTSTAKNKNTANININNTKIKLKYLSDVSIGNGKYKQPYKKKKYNTFSPKTQNYTNKNKFDTEMTLATPNQRTRNKNINYIKNILQKSNLKVENNIPLSTEIYIIPAEKKLTSNIFNSKSISEEYRKENLLKNKITNLPVLLHDKKDTSTPKPAYYKYSTSFQKDQEVYNVLKNSIQTLIHNKSSKKSNLTSSLDYDIHDQVTVSNLKPLKSDKKNKTATYRLIENHVNTLLSNNITKLKVLKHKYKTMMHKTKENNKNTTLNPSLSVTMYEKIFEKNNKKEITDTKMANINNSPTKNESEKFEVTTPKSKNISTTRPQIWTSFQDTTSLISVTEPNQKQSTEVILTSDKEKQNSPDPDDEDSEFLITEITKPPENAMYRSRFNLTNKQQESDLTWEDLTNEFMPAWRSMILDPNKPIYLGYEKTDEKTEEQEDYNINSNFYDLNL